MNNLPHHDEGELGRKAGLARDLARANLKARAELEGCSMARLVPRNVIEATVQGQLTNHGDRTVENYSPAKVRTPSRLRPGTLSRIEVYAQRVLAGQAMFHDDDISLDDCDRLDIQA